jgi:hypothetical protein
VPRSDAELKRHVAIISVQLSEHVRIVAESDMGDNFLAYPLADLK